MTCLIAVRRSVAVLTAACLALAGCSGDDTETASDATSDAASDTIAPTPTTGASGTATASTTPGTRATSPTTAATTAPTTAAASTTATTSTPATSVPLATTPSSAPTSGATPADILTSVLLTPDEVNALGSGDLVDIGWEDSLSAPACGGQPVDVVVPPALEVGTQMQSKSVEAALTEEIRIYGSRDEAGEAFAYGLELFACGGAPDGSVTFGEAVDVTGELVTDPEVAPEADYAVRVIPVSTPEFEGSLVVARYNDSLITFEFLRELGVTDEQLPAGPLDIAELGIGKVLALGV